MTHGLAASSALVRMTQIKPRPIRNLCCLRYGVRRERSVHFARAEAIDVYYIFLGQSRSVLDAGVRKASDRNGGQNGLWGRSFAIERAVRPQRQRLCEATQRLWNGMRDPQPPAIRA